MEATNKAETAYDKVLYPTGVFPQSHPNRLATVAFLRGLQPASIDHCRVLELGCGDGSNLVGMAFQLPESEFVGLDLARRPIASGQSFINELGLRNLSLHSMDLCEASTEKFGRFDFIIAHGLYSWVPQPVQERILAICREMMNPQGAAYVSYNAYPGNHLRDLVRGMMRFHAACFEDPNEKVGQARGLLKFLAESRPNPDYYVAAIREQFERTVKYTDEAFFHDDLSEINQPFYFYQFIKDAERHGLQFVGEASSNELNLEKFNPDVAQKMNELKAASELVREQYKDFIRGCAFRQTIVCHREIKLAPELVVERVPKLHALCDAAPTEKSATDSHSVTVFRRPGGAEVETAHPLIRAALKILGDHWPCPVFFETLLSKAQAAIAEKSIASSQGDESATLAEALSRVYRAGFLQLQVFPHEATNKANERPIASRLARFQLERGDCATNQLHVSLKFPDPLSRELVLLLDGTRDQRMLTRELIEFVRAGRGKVHEEGVLVENLDQLTVILERRVREGVNSLAREGMLVG